MVNFGNPANGLSAQLEKREHIEEILLATRPYGATPIAGMLKGAEDFFWRDSSVDQDPEPASATLDFGPKNDPYVLGGCRDQAILLLTDGQPNLDLRPHCEATPEEPVALCPFDEPETIVSRLVGTTHPKKIPTYVIGFALDSLFYSSRYWIDDPWQYRLPDAYGPYRWVRYYDDALLVDIYSGEVVDGMYDFFW